MLLANAPLIPFVHNVEDMAFVFYVFCRYSGLFLVSPLFTNRNVSTPVRMGLAFFAACLTAMTLYDQYLGPEPKFDAPWLRLEGDFGLIRLGLNALSELIVGFLIGWVFYLFVEALLLAGQQAGMMLGYSMAEIFDPISGSSQGILSQLFLITGSLLLLTLDLHHVFLRMVFHSFDLVPVAHASYPVDMARDISSGGSRIFEYALRLIAIPYLTLILITVGLGFMTRIMPEMNIFMVGFPVKILVGLFGVYAAVGYFPEQLQGLFTELFNLAGRLLRFMGE